MRAVSRIRDRLDSAANPIMIKDVCQSVHSKVTMLLSWSMLVLALLISFICILPAEEGRGGAMFAAFAVVLGVMLKALIPVMVFTSLYQDVRQKTFELVQITAMSASGLAWGRLQAAGLRIVFVLSLMAPFAVASSLFGGADLATVLLSVYGLTVAAFIACAVALFCASMSVYANARMLGVLGFVLFAVTGTTGASAVWTGPIVGPAFMSISVPSAAAGRDALVLMAWLTAYAVAAVLCLMAAAANALTFSQDRSWARTKVMSLLLVGVAFGGMAVLKALGHAGFSGREFQVAACAFLGACSVFWVNGDFRVPYRHRVRLAKRGRLGRLLYLPFRDGASSSAVYLSLAMGLVVLGTLLLGGASGSSPLPGRALLFLPVGTAVYVLYVSALAGMGVWMLPASRRTVTARRTALLLVLIANFLAALLLSYGGLSGKPRAPSAVTALLPVLYVRTFDWQRPLGQFLGHTAVPFLIGLTYHVVKGVREAALMRTLMAAPAPEASGAAVQTGGA